MSLPSEAEEVTWKAAKDDFVESFFLMGKGFTSQFNVNNFGHAAVFTPALWHAFREDDRYLIYFQGKSRSGFIKAVSDNAIFMNFPFFNARLYYLGKKKDDSKLVQFAKENFAFSF